MVYAGVPCFVGLGLADGHDSTFRLLLYTIIAGTWHQACQKSLRTPANSNTSRLRRRHLWLKGPGNIDTREFPKQRVPSIDPKKAPIPIMGTLKGCLECVEARKLIPRR